MFPILLLILFISTYTNSSAQPSSAQSSNEKIMYIVDSIPVIDNLGDEDEISQDDIADITVVKNKDTLKLFGYEQNMIWFCIFLQKNIATDLKI